MGVLALKPEVLAPPNDDLPMSEGHKDRKLDLLDWYELEERVRLLRKTCGFKEWRGGEPL